MVYFLWKIASLSENRTQLTRIWAGCCSFVQTDMGNQGASVLGMPEPPTSVKDSVEFLVATVSAHVMLLRSDARVCSLSC